MPQKTKLDLPFKIINFLLLNVVAPVLLAFALSPVLIDSFFGAEETTRKILVQMLCYAGIFVMMMKNGEATITISIWAIVIAVFSMAHLLNTWLP